jgi:hypothetical protein
VLAPVGPGALVPLKMAVAAADSVGNDVYVAVVVDFGSGSSMSSVSKCVPVASNAHDSDALAAAVGAGNVAYNNSGLLCAIDNYPANGVQNCGESVGPGNYDYWSYWHGSSGSWAYANDGPTEQSVTSPPNDVEGNDVAGLRFQTNQPDNGSDPPPTVAPAYAQICNASTEVPPAQAPSAAATTTTTTTATPTPASVTPTTGTATTGRAGTGPALATTPTTAAGTRPKSGVSTTTAGPGATTTTTTTTLGSGDTASGGASAHGSSSTHSAMVASAASRHSGGGASSNVLPAILIAVVVAALGGLALFRWRRRPAEE